MKYLTVNISSRNDQLIQRAHMNITPLMKKNREEQNSSSIEKLRFQFTNERYKFRLRTTVNSAVIAVVPVIVDLFNVRVGKPNEIRKIAITWSSRRPY